MVKVSITLPNNTQINFESEEPGVVEQVIAMVLRDLPRDLMGPIVLGNGDPGSPQNSEKSTSVAAASSSETSSPEQSAVAVTEDDPPALDSPQTSTAISPESYDAVQAPPRQPIASPLSRPGQSIASVEEEAFIEFCHSVSPLGDMRMVVVAAEGAKRFLSMESVETPDLERLFALAGWRNPHSFIQTLRNAARSKFRWMERLPGRSGRYTVTELGRAVILGE